MSVDSPAIGHAAARLRNFIGGQWGDSSARDELPVHDPGTGEILGRVPLSEADEVNAAVEAAGAAFPAWRATPAVERARVLFRLEALLEEHLEQIAVTLTREHGKTLPDARGETSTAVLCAVNWLPAGDDPAVDTTIGALAIKAPDDASGR